MSPKHDLSFVVILPTYNNIGTLPGVLQDVTVLGLPIIVVNDGSTDGTSSWLESWSSGRGNANAWHRVIGQSENRGKAAALIAGFDMASEAGFTHAVTIDTDGQLLPSEIPSLIDVARRHPASMVIGARNDRAVDYPTRSRFGRRFSNAMIWMECGARVDDSQCGMRVYPLNLFETVHPRAGRYAMETEIITLAQWAGFGIVNARVTCRYFAGAPLVSHFRVGRETWQSIVLHARLLAQAPFRRLVRRMRGLNHSRAAPVDRR